MVDLEANTNKFCYTCLKHDAGRTNYLRLDFSIPGDIPYTKKLKFCIPEMMLENIDDCIMCKQCSIALDSAYLFRAMCLETENKLQLLRQPKEIVAESSLQDEQNLSDFNVVDVRSLFETEENGDMTGVVAVEAPAIDTTSIDILTDTTSIAREKPLTDQEIIEKCCNVIPELKGLTAQSLQCWVVSEKIVPIRYSGKRTHPGHIKKVLEKFWCSICNRYILQKHHYQTHIKKHLNIAYKCAYCLVGYKNQKELNLHKTLCFKERKIVSQITKRKPELGNKREVKTKRKPKVNMKVKLKVRIGNGIRKGALSCRRCNFKTNSKFLLKTHSKSHVSSSQYHCKYCSKGFKDCKKFIHHLQETKHSTMDETNGNMQPLNPTDNVSDTTPFECTLCSKFFLDSNKLLRHMQEAKHTNRGRKPSGTQQPDVSFENNLGTPPYQCTFCTKIFHDINKFVRHMQEAKHTRLAKNKSGRRQPSAKPIDNTMGTPPFKCTSCFKIFYHVRKFRRHVRNAKHTRLGQKKISIKRPIAESADNVGTSPFECTTCSKIFLDINEFLSHRHEDNHATTNNTKANKRRGIKRSIPDLGTPPFVCTSCSKVFYIASKFLRHMREVKHTRKINVNKMQAQVEVKQEKFFCDVCDKDFISEFDLEDHRDRLHQNAGNCKFDEVPEDIPSEPTEPSIEYYCNICTTKFKKVEYFFNHNCVTESLDPLYNCHLCNMSFSTRISLIEHMQVHFTVAS